MIAKPSPEVEAEMALAELTGLDWNCGQTKWRGWIMAFDLIDFCFPTDAHLTLYAPDGRRVAGHCMSGVTERELQYKTLAWGIGIALELG
jgi:hypothetical protein